jgi:hypothetical protein
LHCVKVAPASGVAGLGYAAATKAAAFPPRYLAVNSTDGKASTWPRKAFTIHHNGRPAALPRAAAKVTGFDYGYSGATSVKRGSVLRLASKGDEDHMFIALKVPKGETAKHIKQQLREGKDGDVQSEVKYVGNLSDPISPGAVNQSRVTLPRGTFVLACFMSTKKGVEHTKLGMESTLVIR